MKIVNIFALYPINFTVLAMMPGKAEIMCQVHLATSHRQNKNLLHRATKFDIFNAYQTKPTNLN